LVGTRPAAPAASGTWPPPPRRADATPSESSELNVVSRERLPRCPCPGLRLPANSVSWLSLHERLSWDDCGADEADEETGDGASR